MKAAKINDKIEEIEKYLDELSSIMPADFEEYKQNFEKKAACERYFEKITESIVDLAFLVIKDRDLKIPEEDKETFDILADDKIIPLDLAPRLKDAKGMRNIISHQYGNVDDEIVYESITKELERDVEELIRHVKKKYSNKKP
ncbi:MAG: DUF86 domain-containing protein [Nanoarchaeota archaeon]|nr:DUF86 domain-containing protein [Nanoarchaeota archaeon]